VCRVEARRSGWLPSIMARPFVTFAALSTRVSGLGAGGIGLWTHRAGVVCELYGRRGMLERNTVALEVAAPGALQVSSVIPCTAHPWYESDRVTSARRR